MGGRRGLRCGKQPSRGDSGCSPTPRLRFRLPWLGKFPSRMGQHRWGALTWKIEAGLADAWIESHDGPSSDEIRNSF